MPMHSPTMQDSDSYSSDPSRFISAALAITAMIRKSGQDDSENAESP